MGKSKRIAIALLSAFCFNISVMAQSIPYVAASNITVKQAIAKVKKATGYSFVFQSKEVDVNKKVELDASDIKTAVKQIAEGQNLTFEINGKTIVLKAAPVQQTTVVASSTTISGQVVDENGEPVIGATVVVPGTNIGTITDYDGRYTLVGAPVGGKVQVSSIGYSTNVVNLRNNARISLQPAYDELDEVVVVGYGSIEKKKITSAIASIKAEDFVAGSIKSAGQLIKGKIAGLDITTPSGNPAGDVEIMLRGTNSLKSGSTPLVLIDGVPGDLKLVSPDDIESIDVLKDGSAAAIYGTRANNGVILITTKQAMADGKSRITYNGNISTERISRTPEVLTAERYRNLLSIGNGYIEENSDYGSSTDWLDEITRTPISHYHSASIDWGNQKTSVYANISTRQAQGVFLNSDTHDLTGRITINHKSFDDLVRFNLNAILNSLDYTTTVDGDNSFNSYAYSQALTANPTAPTTMPDGNWCQPKFLGIDMATWENPLALLKERKGVNKNQTSRLYGNITVLPIDGLKLNLLLSYQRYNMTRGFSQSSKDISNTVYSATPLFASRASTSTEEKMLEFTAQYDHTFELHQITGLAGYSYNANVYEHFWMNNYGFPSDQLTYNNMGLGSALAEGKAGMYSYKRSGNLIGFFGRINYNFAERYMISASLRHEGDSKFVGSTKEWGLFPSISAAWRINKEKFMQNLKFVDDLKLRIGYGVTGTAPSAYYQTISRLAYTGTGNSFYYDGEWVTPIKPANNVNTDFTWEKKNEFNIGLDFSFLKGRIGGSVDLYNRKTTDLLWDFSVPVPPYEYGTTTANIGTITNKGVEFAFNFVPVKTKLVTWRSSVMFSTNTSKLTELDYSAYQVENPRDYFFTNGLNSNYTCTHRVKVGEPIGQIWGYKVAGITEEGNWLFDDPTNPGSTFTTNDEGISIETHGQVLGNSVPKYYLNLNNEVRIGKFDVCINMRGAFNYKVINQYRLYNENVSNKRSNNKPVSAFEPVMGVSVNKNPVEKVISYYVEKGDYWKVDNITIGYTMNTPRLKYLNSFRVYMAIDNALIFTNYSGNDPESASRSGLAPGIDFQSQYPTTRSYTLGLNLNF